LFTINKRTDMEFETKLEEYRANLLEFKVTGVSEYKTRADRAEKWVQDYIQTLRTSVQSDAAYISRFVKEYESTNPDIVKFQKDIQEARKRGPELSDIYEGEKKVIAEEPVDETLFYTKVAAIGGILAIGAVAAFF
jgi:hypothetical protein